MTGSVVSPKRDDQLVKNISADVRNKELAERQLLGSVGGFILWQEGSSSSYWISYLSNRAVAKVKHAKFEAVEIITINNKSNILPRSADMQYQASAPETSDSEVSMLAEYRKNGERRQKYKHGNVVEDDAGKENTSQEMQHVKFRLIPQKTLFSSVKEMYLHLLTLDKSNVKKTLIVDAAPSLAPVATSVGPAAANDNKEQMREFKTDLDLYIRRIESHRDKDNKIDFAHGFNFLASWQAKNRLANYNLAIKLANEVDAKLKEKAVFSVDTIASDKHVAELRKADTNCRLSITGIFGRSELHSVLEKARHPSQHRQIKRKM